jgi:hypothetical protein
LIAMNHSTLSALAFARPRRLASSAPRFHRIVNDA